MEHVTKHDIEIVPAQDDPKDFVDLVREYTTTIREHGVEVEQMLASQNLEAELENVHGKYGAPTGAMYVAMDDGHPAGCAALTKNDDTHCEIKRVYVRPEYRGQGVSRALLDQVIADAKSKGYKHMRLDTFPFMKNAVALYEKYGFKPIEKYNNNPAKSAIFLEMDL